VNLLRVGDTIINLDNVLQVDLDWEGKVVFEFVMRGMDELDEGQNVTQPYLAIIEGDEAEAVRRYLKAKCPDIADE
jgi:hypothetical protein